MLWNQLPNMLLHVQKVWVYFIYNSLFYALGYSSKQKLPKKKKNCFLQKCCILMEGVRNITNINEKVCQTSLRGMYFGSCAVTILKKVVGRATLRGDIWAYSWKMRMPTMQVQSALISTGSTSVIQSTADKKYLRKKLCCCWYVLCNWLMVVTTLVNTHKHLSCYHSLNNTV